MTSTLSERAGRAPRADCSTCAPTRDALVHAELSVQPTCVTITAARAESARRSTADGSTCSRGTIRRSARATTSTRVAIAGRNLLAVDLRRRQDAALGAHGRARGACPAIAGACSMPSFSRSSMPTGTATHRAEQLRREVAAAGDRHELDAAVVGLGLRIEDPLAAEDLRVLDDHVEQAREVMHRAVDHRVEIELRCRRRSSRRTAARPRRCRRADRDRSCRGRGCGRRARDRGCASRGSRRRGRPRTNRRTDRGGSP